MKVALKVIGGKYDGKEISISIPRFIVGRGDTAHLKPASDLVSREHAAIEVQQGKVVLVDLSSRNGTFLNGEKITQSVQLKPGDLVRIGKLQFQMVIDLGQASAKRPKVNNIAEAASRTAAVPKKESLEDSITDWLMEGDDDDAPATEERKLISTAETVQFKIEDTTTLKEEEVEPSSTENEPLSDEEDLSESKTMFGFKGKSKGKPKPGKLPPIEKQKHDSSTSAADDVLRKFFNRR